MRENCRRLDVVFQIAATAALALLGGCAKNQHNSSPYSIATPGPRPLPQVEPQRRGAIEPQISPSVRGQATSSKQAVIDWPDDYQPLHAQTCQCTAAANSTVANLLVAEADLAGSGQDCSSDEEARAAAVQRETLLQRARDERNRAAGAALELFYELVKLEFQHDAVERSIEQNRPDDRELAPAADPRHPGRHGRLFARAEQNRSGR